MSELITDKAIWPEVFTDPDFEYDADDPLHVGKAFADGLSGWACCIHGDVPEGFGLGMAKIAMFTKCGPSAEDLAARARELGFLGP